MAVTAWILVKVVLVVFFGPVETAERLQLYGHFGYAQLLPGLVKDLGERADY